MKAATSAQYSSMYQTINPIFNLRFRTTNIVAFGVLIVLLLLCAPPGGFTVSLGAQTPPKPAPTPDAVKSGQTGSGDNLSEVPHVGIIKGSIVADDGRPMGNAIVWARSVTGTQTAKSARADSKGRFVLRDLPVAVYVIFATVTGYIDQSLTSNDTDNWPHYLIGSEVRIRMIKGGVITGTVTDANGAPVVGVPIHASTLSGVQSAVLNPFDGSSSPETDDRGIYRIYGLQPGEYIVSAGGSGLLGQFNPSGFEMDVLTYYPSSNRDTAATVTVRPGDESTNIDIKYRGIEGHSISGVVVGTAEATASNPFIVLLLPAGSTAILSTAVAVGATARRTFNFTGLADGEYDIFAELSTGSADSWVSTKHVTVRGNDLTGIEMKLAQLASISGTITLDSIKAGETCDKRRSQLVETVVFARRDDLMKPKDQEILRRVLASTTTLNAKGEFGVHNMVDGRYRLDLSMPTDSWYVRSISLPSVAAQKGSQPSGTSNRWQGTVSVKPGERMSGLSVVIGQNAAGLSGRVALSSNGAAIPAGLRLHLVPAEREQADNVLRYFEAPVNGDGSFALTNLAPGRYFVIAQVEAAAGVESTNPRPTALDPALRAKLLHDAAAANQAIDLKPCQRMTDYRLEFKTSK